MVSNCRHCNRSFKYQHTRQRHEQLDCPKRPVFKPHAVEYDVYGSSGTVVGVVSFARPEDEQSFLRNSIERGIVVKVKGQDEPEPSRDLPDRECACGAQVTGILARLGAIACHDCRRPGTVLHGCA